MTIFHTMSLAGSFMMLYYLLMYKLISKSFSLKWRKNYLKITILVYIFPFQLLKWKYLELLQYLFSVWKISSKTRKNKDFIRVSDFTVYISNRKLLMSMSSWIIFCVIIVCAMVGLLMLCKEIYRFVHFVKKLRNNSIKISNKDYQAFLLIDKRYKRFENKIEIRKCDYIISPFTVGFIHPIIVIPNIKLNQEEWKDIYYHELTHIMEKDNLIKWIVYIVLIIHIFNPFIFLLLWEWNRLAEFYCDECITSKQNLHEKKVYCQLMYKLSETRNYPFAFIGFQLNTSLLKQRIINISKGTIKMKKKNKIVGSIICGLAMIVTSFTTLAYEPTYVEYTDDINEVESMETYFSYDEDPYKDTDEFLKLIPEENGWIFIDEDKQIYEINENNINMEPYASCNHTYKSGTLTKHSKTGEACSVKYYDGQICTRCKKTIQGDLIKTMSYTKCPH